jgi:[protein-PII] uridylyltransferase
MRATNPEAWSDWKYQLLSDLYNKALTVLKRGLDHPIDIDKTIFKKKQHCIKKLTQGDFSYNQVNEIWDTFRKSYFIHYHESDILTHTAAIINHQNDSPLVLLYNDEKNNAVIFLFIHTIQIPYFHKFVVV